MNFKTVTIRLIEAFMVQRVRYALIGGFALGLWGVHRSTVDIDFLIHRDDLGKVDDIMKALGYELEFSSVNVSQYVSALSIFGEVDFLHAFRETSLRMLEDAVEMDIFDGAYKIRVLRPEDIIGLKVQALNNNPKRREAELSDIFSLIDTQIDNIDWAKIETYFSIFQMEGLFYELRGRFKDKG